MESEAPGGWLQLRDALDYSDADRFPVAQFGGPVNRSNTARLQKIVEHFAPMGAVLEDVVPIRSGPAAVEMMTLPQHCYQSPQIMRALNCLKFAWYQMCHRN
eukprot:COSAG01_NODE_2317_length_7922_cov_18.384763_6_plen_102_part_00